jgi:hypothetical protein
MGQLQRVNLFQVKPAADIPRSSARGRFRFPKWLSGSAALDNPPSETQLMDARRHALPTM